MPKFVAFLFLLFLSFNLQAQTWEVGGFVGGAGYMGDLNQNNPLKISGVSAGVFIKRNFDGYLSAKLQYNFGQIAGADSTSSNLQTRQRNLSFQTQLNELSVIGEFNFFKYIPEAGQNRFTPYIYLGIGVVGYNPQANYQGQTYDLRPLMTEGESKPYSKLAFSIPYGAGVKYNFSGKWNFNADIGYRHPSTDYLDDVSGVYPNRTKLSSDLARALSDRSGEVNGGLDIGSPGSQRGDLRPKDTYLFINLGISFTFVSSKCYY
jgi:hypothetical protein